MMMMTSEGETSGKNNIRFPFTPTQYHELEHQALIFRYIASGIPIPLHLIPTIKPDLDPFLHLHQPQHIGWNYFQMGYGRKIDPEPGRCRRTDGKKWRCSKEAYTDSKYCERHMHRGRNRSRKPVENNKSPNNISFSISVPTPIGTKSPQNPSKPTSISTKNSPTATPHQLISPFLYPHSTTSGFGLESGLHYQKQNHKDYSNYFHGIKEKVGEQSFMSSNSGGTIRSMSDSSVGDNSWHIDQPLPINKQRNFSGLQSGHSYLQPTSREKQQDDINEWGEMMKMEINNEPQKVMHHFFDEWPKNKDPWEDYKLSNNSQASEIELSISMPRPSHHDFFQQNSQWYTL